MENEKYKFIFNQVALRPTSDESQFILGNNYKLLKKDINNKIIPYDLLNVDSSVIYITVNICTDLGELKLYHINDHYDFLINNNKYMQYSKYEWFDENIKKLKKLNILLRDSYKKY
jgi:hypothetical protein